MTDSFGVWLVAFGEMAQEGKDVFRGNLCDRAITEFLDIFLDDGPVPEQIDIIN